MVDDAICGGNPEQCWASEETMHSIPVTVVPEINPKLVL